jgi:hypothetical protein
MAEFIVSENESEVELDPEIKVKLETLRIHAFGNSSVPFLNSLFQYNMRWQFAFERFGSYKTFAEYELFNAVENLTKTNLPIAFYHWQNFDISIAEFKEEVKKAKSDDKNWWHDFYLTSQFSKDNFNHIFLEILQALDLTLEYGNAEDFPLRIDYTKATTDFSDRTKYPRDWDKVVNLVSQFRWVEFLISMIEGEGYNEKADISPKPKKRTLSDIALQYVWEGTIINTKNKDQVAKLFPELELKNGTKLYQKFNYFSKTTNRTGDSGKESTNKKHLDDMNRALSFLTKSDHIEKAKNEIVTFKNNAKEVSGQTL